MIKKLFILLIGIIGFNTVNAAELKVGDYVKMTPTSTRYTILKALTGHDSDQTINPSELNLWRVIKLNSDGSVEMVSEYISSKLVILKGQTGYLKLPQILNTIAKQYENSTFTKGSRHMGYNGQIMASTIDTTPADTLYVTDADLVKKACNTLKANTVGTTTANNYWLPSRYTDGSSSPQCFAYIIDSNGDTKKDQNLLYLMEQGTGSESIAANAIRPIVILKSGLTTDSGSGTSSNPYTLKVATTTPGEDPDTGNTGDNNNGDDTNTSNKDNDQTNIENKNQTNNGVNKKEDDSLPENPKTGVFISLAMTTLAGIGSVVILYIVRKQNKFHKI